LASQRPCPATLRLRAVGRSGSSGNLIARATRLRHEPEATVAVLFTLQRCRAGAEALDTLSDGIRQFLLKQLADDAIEPRQVCIAARTNDDVDSIVEGLKKAGIATLRLERSTSDDPSEPGVRVATMHRIKGLEFGVVIIAGYKGAAKYAEQFARDEDAGMQGLQSSALWSCGLSMDIVEGPLPVRRDL
jgi:ATP-dependent exoDNAse (exonuclease V) beta subunit